jgi:predicted MPP superfamily phosphohydrolase
MTVIRIAHISDLHLAAGSAFDQQRIVSAALHDLEQAHAARAVDILVFSGDLAFGGKPDQFAMGEDMLLGPFRDRLGLTRAQTILIPGNHDVDREAIVDFVEDGLRSRLKSREAVNDLLETPEELALATARLGNWETFHHDYYGAECPASVGALGFAHEIRVGEVTVGVAALNSSWRARGGEGDRGELIVGDRQVEEALAAITDCDVEVVVLHHPPEWLAAFDANRVHQFFESRRLLVLSGHEHVAEPVYIASRHGSAIYSRAGCLYEKHEYPNTYSIIDVDLEALQVGVRVRAWYPDRETGVFDEATAVAAHGTLTFPWQQESAQSVRPASALVTGALATVAQQTSVIADAFPETPIHAVEDVLVPPRFLRAPYREAVAAASLTSGIDPKLIADPPVVRPGSVVIVCGEPEFGVTSALLWLLALQFENGDGELPLYLDSDVSVGTSRTRRSLEIAATRVGHSLGEGPLPPLIVAIDDVAVKKENRLARVSRYISEHRESGYILGCHNDDYRRITASLQSVGVTPERVFLAPFGRRELRLLIRKLAAGAEGTLIERIFALIRTQGLPRTPLTMAALIAILREEEDPADVNESGLLDAYVNYLLGGSELSDAEGLGMDFRKREHLLAFLASELYKAGKNELGWPEVEECLRRYFNERGLRQSPGLVLRSLVERRVLTEADEVVRFRHPAFLRLFVAKWMFEDAAFAAEVTHRCLTTHPSCDTPRVCAAAIVTSSRGPRSKLSWRLPHSLVSSTSRCLMKP